MKLTKTKLREIIREEIQSLNEASLTQVKSSIKKVKKQLSDRWKKNGGWENFGQNELQKMKDKFQYNPHGDPEARNIARELDDFDNWAMEYVGESINESGMGRLGTDQADVLDAIVMMNKRKGPINILRIAMKDKFLAPYIKKHGISKSEMESYIEEILMMMNYM